MDDDFHDELLTGDGKWWEFLDPLTYEVKALPGATRSLGRELDWSKRRKPGMPVGFSALNHCADCGQKVPADFSFCVHCGGEPRGRSPVKMYAVVITHLDGDFAEEAATELLTAANTSLTAAELRPLLRELPMVFNTVGRHEQLSALVAKLSEVGIAARAFPTDDPSVPWIRETAESLARSTTKVGMCALTLIVGLLGAILLTPWVLWLAFIAVGVLFVRELHWYRQRYHARLDVLQLNLSGFDEETADVTRRALRSISDREVRGNVTVCLMEYYTLTQQFRAHGAVYGEVLTRSARALEELMADVLLVAHRYGTLDAFLRANPRDVLLDRLDTLREAAPVNADARRITDAEIAVLQGQLQSMEKMEHVAAAFREQLVVLAQSMESMRQRFAAVRAQPSVEAFAALQFEETLNELDQEFEVFVETFEVVQ